MNELKDTKDELSSCYESTANDRETFFNNLRAKESECGNLMKSGNTSWEQEMRQQKNATEELRVEIQDLKSEFNRKLSSKIKEIDDLRKNLSRVENLNKVGKSQD